MSKLTPLTPRDLELARGPTIASQFPVVFDNGNEMTSLTGHCPSCDKSLDADFLAGQVIRPFPKVAVVEATGYCPDCKIFARFNYRLYDDMRMTGQIKNGQWGEWHMRRTFKGWVRFILTGKFLRS